MDKLHLNPRNQPDLLRVLRIIQWVIPVMMSLIGIIYTVIEHQRHINDPYWPYPTILAILVLGITGPFISWAILRWTLSIALAYMKSKDELSHRADELTKLNKLSMDVSRSLDPEKRISIILEQTMDALGAEGGMVFIKDDDHPGLRLEAHRGISLDMAHKEERLNPGHCLCGQAVKSSQIIITEDVGDDPRCTSDLCICEGFRSIACAPLIVKDDLVGLLQIASPIPNQFKNNQVNFLAATAGQVSISIENARLYDKVRTFNIDLEQKINQRTRELEIARWKLAEKARQLQRLLSESYRVQEDTQARIAYDMHDGVTQMIIGALYETEAAQQALVDDPNRAYANLFRSKQLLSEVETEIQRVIYDLHPPILDMMGLVLALKRFASNYEATFGINCSVIVTKKTRRLPREIEIAIYRIIQAALNNTASHAQASNSFVKFIFEHNKLVVLITDNGIGFDPETILKTPGDHLGLISMKERAEGINATLNINSSKGKGTTIEVSLLSPPYRG